MHVGHSLFFSLDRIPNRFRILVGDKLFSTIKHFSHSQNFASLSLRYRYFQWKLFWRSTFFSFTRVNHSLDPRSLHCLENHHHFLRIQLVRWKFYSSSFSWTAVLQKQLPRCCFLKPYNFNLELNFNLTTYPYEMRLLLFYHLN